MKKLIVAAAALTAGFVLAADDGIVSSTVVGYQTQDLTGLQCNSIGPTFVSANADTVKLGDIKVEGFKWDSDILQVLSTENAATIKTYVYVTPEAAKDEFENEEVAGWWLKNHEGEVGYSADNIEFDLGQGFLGNFPKKATVFTYTGEVPVGATQLDYSGKQCVLIANPLPSDVKFGDIACEGFKWDSDILQVLSTENAATIKTYVYVTPEADKDDFEGDGAAVGWWIKRHETEAEYSANETEWKSGQALLGNFPKKSVKLTFPSAL